MYGGGRETSKNHSKFHFERREECEMEGGLEGVFIREVVMHVVVDVVM